MATFVAIIIFSNMFYFLKSLHKIGTDFVLFLVQSILFSLNVPHVFLSKSD